jgi:septal ring factor EnvC (AmiA/AmiB activator)
MKKIYFLLFVSTVLLFYSSTALLASPKDDLEQTQKNITEEKTKQEALDEKAHKLEDELRDLKEKLAHTAEAIEDAEADLSAAEDKLRILNDQLQSKTAALKDHRRKLASLLQSALSLSRTPPEAMIMMPGDSLETMQAARALKMLSDGIKQESESIAASQIGELEELKEKVVDERDALGHKQAALGQEHDTLEQQLKQRTIVRAKLGLQQEEEAQKLADLAKKAEDLQDLVGSLQDEDAWKSQGRAAFTPEKMEEATQGHLRSFSAAMGHIRPPAAGRVVQLFGSGHGKNETSKGIVIVTRNHTQVIAPFDGEVVYTGTFLGYGRMVILRHSDHFHTLMAGLSKIDVETGEFLLEGEPIGAMGEGDTGNRLYVELRKNNQPIDPGPWIRGLNH